MTKITRMCHTTCGELLYDFYKFLQVQPKLTDDLVILLVSYLLRTYQ